MRVNKLPTDIVTIHPKNGGTITVKDEGKYRFKYPNTYKSFKELRNGTTNL